MKLKSLILDFGGVLLNIDYDAPVREFRELGIENFNQLFHQVKQSSFMDEFEKGNLSNEEFRNHLRSLTTLHITDEQIDFAWNSILLDFPLERMELLKMLAEKYQLFLLSNTNRIHVNSFEKEMNNVYGKNNFQRIFKKIYYSSSIGMRKPDAEIFKFVLQENNLDKNEICFIDDSIQHIRGAESVGIRSFHLDLSKEKLKDILLKEKII